MPRKKKDMVEETGHMDPEAFILAVKNITAEKEISEDTVFEAMELALATAYKKNFGSKTNVRVDINPDTGDIKVFSFRTVVLDKEHKVSLDENNYDDDSLEGINSFAELEEALAKEAEDVTIDEEGNEVDVPPAINIDAQILLEDAKEIDPDAKLGDTIEKEVTPKDFGRVAAGTAKQVIMQKIREAEKESIIGEFADKQDEMLVGTLAMEDARNYYVELGRTRGILPKSEMIPGETVTMGSTIRVYVTKVESNTKGPLILLSRKHYGFVKRLFELEIPEINDGTVMIYSVARDPGNRSKVAVYSENPNVDPIGACIGEKGSRIARIIEELHGEKLDVIKYDKDPAVFIENALSPAKDLTVAITDPKKLEAMVIADGDNFSLAIGKKGQNARLATRLTKFKKIDIKTTEQAREAGINFR